MFVFTAHGLPQNIMVTSTDPASLRVHWEPPSDMHEGSITGYVIQYTRIGSNDKKNIKVDRETTHTISGLVACEGYSVQVATMTDNATGPFSDAVVEVAGEDGELCMHTHLFVYGMVCTYIPKHAVMYTLIVRTYIHTYIQKTN